MGTLFSSKMPAPPSVPVPPPAATPATIATAASKTGGVAQRQRAAGAKPDELNPTGGQGLKEKPSTAKSTLLGATNLGNPTTNA